MCRTIVVLLLTCLACGCSPENKLGRKPISGSITLDGAALNRGSIQFAPQQAGVSTGAEIVDGSYTIPAHQGLTPGTYTVRVYSADEAADAVEPEIPGPGIKVQPDRIPPEYNRKSDLELVVDEADNKVTFDLSIPSKSAK